MTYADFKQRRKIRKADRQRKKGTANYGRQPIEPVKTELEPTMTARVFRAASDTWEDIEVTNVTVEVTN